MTFSKGLPYSTKARQHCVIPDKNKETTMGHLKLLKQGIRPTSPRTKKHKIEVTVVAPDNKTNTIAFDLPGRYPITSTAGDKYVFIMYDLDSNYIKPILMKSHD